MATEKVKLHARVTREIEVTKEQAMALKHFMCRCASDEEAKIAQEVINMFTAGITAGDYDETGYIPAEWLCNDLEIRSDYVRDLDI